MHTIKIVHSDVFSNMSTYLSASALISKLFSQRLMSLWRNISLEDFDEKGVLTQCFIAEFESNCKFSFDNVFVDELNTNLVMLCYSYALNN